MKRNLLIGMILFASAGFAVAQTGNATSDVLGAHLNYGRGCAACHAPHSGSQGSGNAKTTDAAGGNSILWGEDVASLEGQTINFGGVYSSKTGTTSSYTELLPSSMQNTSAETTGLLTCLSCHDGNLAKAAMMKNAVYETLPATYGKLNTIPTQLGNDNSTTGNYLNDHPVGVNATIGCGGQYNWDCTISATGTIQMTGPNSIQFVANYGFFVKPAVTTANLPYVVCTTCHNQHSMNVVAVTNTSTTLNTAKTPTGLASGNYQTMFFILAPYNPASTTAGSNQTAQFCRQCHGGESNEMNGSNLPTIF